MIAADLRRPEARDLRNDLSQYRDAGIEIALLQLPAGTAPRDRDAPAELEPYTLLQVDRAQSRVTVRLLLVRRPWAVRLQDVECGIEPDACIVVADEDPGGAGGDWDPAVVHRDVAHWAGCEPIWAPTTPQIRAALQRRDRLIPTLPWDWSGPDDARFQLHRLRYLVAAHPTSQIQRGFRRASLPAPLRPLFVCTNGVGVGHLVRVSAIARRCSAWTKPLILTMCPATEIPSFARIPFEYFPSRAYVGLDNSAWNDRLSKTLTHVMELHGVNIVVFDGPFPFKGLLQVRQRHPGVPFVWSKRGLARAESEATRARAAYFSKVIVPRDIAAPDEDFPFDVQIVDPVLLADQDDLLPEREAKAALGLEPERPAALVQLGAGNINDTTALYKTVIDLLRRDGRYQVFLARSAIADRFDHYPGVQIGSAYPLSAYYRAFTVAVTAAGYNSFHESVALRLPTLFIPNTSTSTDDQEKRAATAAAAGIALTAPADDADSIATQVAFLTTPEIQEGLINRSMDAFPGNGARQAAEIVEQLALQSL